MEGDRGTSSRTRSQLKRRADEKDKGSEQRESSEEDKAPGNAMLPAAVEQNQPRIQKKWKVDQTLQTIEDKRDYLSNNPFWKIKFANKRTEGGRKTYYYCNVLGRTENSCAAELCVFESSDTTDYVLHRFGEHTHAENEEPKKVSADVSEKIKNMRDKGLTQRLISDSLRTDENVPRAPTENQVNLQLTANHVFVQTNHVFFLFFTQLLFSSVSVQIIFGIGLRMI